MLAAGALRTGPERAAAAIVAVLLPCAPLAAATTPAGTRIENTAALVFGQGTAAARVPSNTVALVVDEILDVAVVADAPNVAVAAADAVLPVGFVVADTGNGADTFTLLPTADRGTEIAGVAVDSDGDGRYDASRDAALSANAVTLSAGERRRLFVLVRGGTAGAAVSLAATARKGHGAPGTVVPGAGQGGADVVIGQTGASANARTLLVDGATAAPRLDKFQSVVAADGSARARPGAIITYRLEARFAGPVVAVDIADAIPAGTVFVPGSITLDDRPLTDADDGDAAMFDGAIVHVAIGDVTAATLRTIRFQTRIQ